SLVALAVSCAAWVNSRKRHEENTESEFRPALTFTRSEDEVWHLANVGKGSAINVQVLCSREGKKWEQRVNARTLAADQQYAMPWITKGGSLAVCYTDIHGREYHTKCTSYKNELGKGDIPTPHLKIEQEWDLNANLAPIKVRVL
ncbi:MAG: hypothetical protein ACI9OD_000001, partial [Limisphaerales bacterium]